MINHHSLLDFWFFKMKSKLEDSRDLGRTASRSVIWRPGSREQLEALPSVSRGSQLTDERSEH